MVVEGLTRPHCSTSLVERVKGSSRMPSGSQGKKQAHLIKVGIQDVGGGFLSSISATPVSCMATQGS